jgi:hypothetical protein
MTRRKAKEDLTGKTFGRLTVIHSTWSNGFKWVCRCSCGNVSVVQSKYLNNGHVISCGCMKHVTRLTHGLTGTPEYEAFRGAKQRCLNPKNPNYHNYGGRGIKFLLTSVEDIVKDIGMRPSANHSIDRINNDGHYEVGNIRWATMVQQIRNTRRCLESASDYAESAMGDQ